MIKKISAVLVCLLLMLSFAGCGGESAESVDTAQADVDLTTLSSTMVYSEVYNMLCTPDDYIGKTIKMKGSATSFYDENDKETYYACIIQDATACCTQGLEYTLKGSAEYPPDGDEILVMGTFQTYTAPDGNLYCKLDNATVQ